MRSKYPDLGRSDPQRTRGNLNDRGGNPNKGNGNPNRNGNPNKGNADFNRGSGLDVAMSAHADQMHPVRKR